MIALGVVADTHIPERMKALPPEVHDVFRGVTAILHAGDVSTQPVLDELETIAPVYAVAGNRDFLLGLPSDLVLEFGGVRIGMTHGHGGWRTYLVEKVVYHAAGYHLGRYTRLARARFSDVQAIVFGHIHRPVNQLEDGVLMFNPGSLGPDYFPPHGPAVGLLTIEAGRVRGEIVRL
ncbi:MAG: metallophosphoesterase family protein [Chloroflexi bacterium]|nr:metallophosphoesterase family protein [Chloroflexota bacterium]